MKRKAKCLLQGTILTDMTATPTRLPFEKLKTLAGEIIREVPGVVSATYNIAPKPPSTIEVV